MAGYLKYDLSGQRFGKLAVIEFSPNAHGTRSGWKCICDCGNTTIASSQKLRNGRSVSCGCYRKELTAAGLGRRHGQTGTPLHTTWESMIERCTSPTSVSYPHYGARGISVCDRWLIFENFAADMGDRPNGLSLDRIDNNGNYEPGNCRWADAKTQSSNRRNNRLIEYEGGKYTARQLSDMLGLRYESFRQRMNRGQNIIVAIEKTRILKTA